MTTSIDLFWHLFQSTGSLEAYLLYRQKLDTAAAS